MRADFNIKSVINHGGSFYSPVSGVQEMACCSGQDSFVGLM